MDKYTEEDVLHALNNGDFLDAEDLLASKLPKIELKMKKAVKSLASTLDEVKKVFPDAIFYTASGGLTLMLGNSHSEREVPQQELIAASFSELISISDGDF